MLKKLLSTALVFSSLAISAPVFAADTMTTTPTTGPSATTIACVGTAVTARETMIGTAFATFSSAQSAALAARLGALKAAWAMTTSKEIKPAVGTAWQNYRTAHRAAVKAHSQSVNTAWKQFRVAAKACKPGKLPIETGTASDNSLAQ
jgi:hypothetical protein